MGLLRQKFQKLSVSDDALDTGSSISSAGYNVLLTGTTGNLGAYLLDSLLAQPEVKKVICLNRSANAKERQLDAHKRRGLTNTISDKRVTFLQASFDKEGLGLRLEDYNLVSESVDVLIHNAWPVDFNRNFTSFKPSIDGVQRLIDLCLTRCPGRDGRPGSEKPQKPPIRFLFISSIGATSNWGSAAPSARSDIPEVELTDWKVARTGYGQSKLLSERLLAYSARNLSLPVSIVRVGQLSGPVYHGDQGRWPDQEWLPSLIRSSIALRALPEGLGPVEDVDWVPADIAAQAIVELCTNLVVKSSPGDAQRLKSKIGEARIFHVVNPRMTTWTQLRPTIQRWLPVEVKLVPFVQWVDKLKKSAEEAGGFQGVDEGANPAAKLIDFFDNLQDRAIRFPKTRASPLETKKTVKVSKTLAELQAVGPEWMELWMTQWKLGT